VIDCGLHERCGYALSRKPTARGMDDTLGVPPHIVLELITHAPYFSGCVIPGSLALMLAEGPEGGLQSLQTDIHGIGASMP
jgi:hypothetical protein